MLRGVTLRPPVIFEAITRSLRRVLSFASQDPIICSVSPSGCCRSEGMGYCSAVSMKLTPLARAMSSIWWHAASSGALKSVLPHRCVPSASWLTRMPLEPRLR
eukprot:scaffold89644_cov32-Tisochrysis_lutea.AAC.1